MNQNAGEWKFDLMITLDEMLEGQLSFYNSSPG